MTAILFFDHAYVGPKPVHDQMITNEVLSLTDVPIWVSVGAEEERE